MIISNAMVIINAKYFVGPDGSNQGVQCTINGVVMSVPLDTDNSHYAEILRQVAAGTLTIEDAD